MLNECMHPCDKGTDSQPSFLDFQPEFNAFFLLFLPNNNAKLTENVLIS